MRRRNLLGKGIDIFTLEKVSETISPSASTKTYKINFLINGSVVSGKSPSDFNIVSKVGICSAATISSDASYMSYNVTGGFNCGSGSTANKTGSITIEYNGQLQSYNVSMIKDTLSGTSAFLESTLFRLHDDANNLSPYYTFSNVSKNNRTYNFTLTISDATIEEHMSEYKVYMSNYKQRYNSYTVIFGSGLTVSGNCSITYSSSYVCPTNIHAASCSGVFYTKKDFNSRSYTALGIYYDSWYKGYVVHLLPNTSNYGLEWNAMIDVLIVLDDSCNLSLDVLHYAD